MIDRTKVWTGSLNEMALDPQPRATVGLYDTTLRDGEQSVGVVLSPEDKLEIAVALDAAGIDRIEAGFPRVSAEDWRAVELVSAAGLRAEVWGFSRAVQADVEALVELGVPASVIESPISDAKLAALGVSREKMLERISSAVSFAAGGGIKVAFFGVDSSRADLDFYRRAYETAVEAGAQEVVVVDTIGIATPEAAAYLVGQTVDWLGGEIPVHWHGHDDFGLGTAAAIAAVQAGATLGAGDDQRDGGARRERRPDRGRSRARGALRDSDTPRPDAGAEPLAARPGASRDAAAVVEGGDGGCAVHARVRRGRGPVPRSARDRALQLGARRRRRAASCSARRAASTRSGSRPSGSISTSRRRGEPSCWRRSRSSECARGGSSATRSSSALVAAGPTRASG